MNLNKETTMKDCKKRCQKVNKRNIGEEKNLGDRGEIECKMKNKEKFERKKMKWLKFRNKVCS